MERASLGKMLILAVGLPLVLVFALRETPDGTPMVLPVMPRMTPMPPPVVAAKKLAPPTVTTTCMTADTELVANDEYPILCWPNGVCGFGDDVVPRPTVTPVIAASAFAIENGELWHGTHRVKLPAQVTKGWDRETGIEAMFPLGDRALVVRGWDPDTIPPPPSTPSRGTIVDARGKIISVIAVDPDRAPVPLGDDGFLVFDGAGAFTLVVGGVPKIYGELGEWHASNAGSRISLPPGLTRLEGRVSHIQAVVLTGVPATENTGIEGDLIGTQRIAKVGASWCDDESCHVTTLQIGFQTNRHGPATYWIDRSDDHSYPYCGP